VNRKPSAGKGSDFWRELGLCGKVNAPALPRAKFLDMRPGSRSPSSALRPPWNSRFVTRKPLCKSAITKCCIARPDPRKLVRGLRGLAAADPAGPLKFI